MQQFSSILIGAVGGLVVGLGASVRWGDDLGAALSSPNFATLLAGLGGATIGSIISYLTARQSSKLTLDRDARARFAEERSQALSVMVTTMQLANRLHTLNLKLKDAVKGEDGDAWQKLQAAPDESIVPLTFDPKDLVPFVDQKSGELIHRLFLLADRTRSIESSFNVYGRLRLEFEDYILPFSKHLPGDALLTSFPDDQLTVARYRINQLNGLIDQMRDYCARDLDDAKSIIDELNAAYRDRFGETGAFQLAMDGPDPNQSAS